MSDSFPLLTLQPAGDADNRWVALLLEGDVPLDGATLVHVLNGLELSEALSTLACVAAVNPVNVEPSHADNLPRDHVVLRIPMVAATDPAQQDHLAALHTAGFRLMATGVPVAGSTLSPAVQSLAMTCPDHLLPEDLAYLLHHLHGPHLALGAVGNTCPGFCKFQWMTGHLAGHLSPSKRDNSGSRAVLIKLLSLVTSDAESSELEAVIKRDPGLSYNLLKLVNSVAFAPASKIANFNQAIAILGRRQLQRWLQLLLYTRSQGSDKSSPLLPRAALRARLMEDLAKAAKLTRDEQDHAFMVGMFSLLDVLFGVPIAEIIRPLNLSDDIVQALTAGQGPLGGLLAVVNAAEGPPSTILAEALAAAGIGREEWAAILTEAAVWAVHISREA
jgi:EAL and modified HD-GYP domain-containing signal transduction protein